MVWVIVIDSLLLLVAAWFLWRSPQRPPDGEDYRVVVDLHAIRRRLEVARFKAELKRDEARLRREMRDELDMVDHRRRL